MRQLVLWVSVVVMALLVVLAPIAMAGPALGGGGFTGPTGVASQLAPGATGTDLTLSGMLTAGGTNVTASTIPTSGIYRRTGTELSFSSGASGTLSLLSNELFPLTNGSVALGDATVRWNGIWNHAVYTTDVASGSNAFAVETNGARIDFGAGASDYASSDGTTVTFAGPISTTIVTSTGSNTNLFTGPIQDNYSAGTAFLAAGGAAVEFGCSSNTCNFNSASGTTADFDCGGGTCTAQLGAANATTTTVGRSGQTTTINGSAAFGTREFVVDKVSSGIAAGNLLATGTNYSGYKLPQAWTLTHMSINVTTASSATVANTVLTTTDGTNTCTFTFACNTDSNTTGVKDKAGVNGAGTGCVYAAGALVTMSVTTQGCATAITTNSITTWGKPQ